MSSLIRKDEHVSGLLITVINPLKSDLLFHQKCYDNYTHPKTLKIIQQKENKEEEEEEDSEDEEIQRRTSTRKRDRIG